MRWAYAAVLAVALSAIVVDHLSSPSAGRAVSPEDFAGACAPCGAPCPSTQRRQDTH
jgi:hypothetical protein